MLVAEVSSANQAVSPFAPESVSEWVEFIEPDIIRGNTCFLMAGRKLNAAKEALRGIQGGFGQLIENLGLDQDKAEGLMRVARHSLLEKMITDSVTSRKIPLGWTVLAELARISPEILEALIATGGVGPTTTRRKARQLVNHLGDDDHGDTGDDDHGDTGGDEDGDRHADLSHSFDSIPHNALLESPGEADRELEAKQAHIDEIKTARERDSDLAERLRLAEIKITGLEGEIADRKNENTTLRARIAELEDEIRERRFAATAEEVFKMLDRVRRLHPRMLLKNLKPKHLQLNGNQHDPSVTPDDGLDIPACLRRTAT